jgi:hypothetical protein
VGPEVAELRAVEPEPPWNDESFDTSEGGVERPSEVLAEEQILPPEPEAKNQIPDSEPPWHGELFETSEGGSETPPSPPEPRAEGTEQSSQWNNTVSE